MESYVVVKNKDIYLFQEQCNYQMGNGYVPQGGLVKGDYEFFQAFTLDEKKEEVPKNIPPKKKAGRPKKPVTNMYNDEMGGG